jgi:hypothetical protein
VQSRLIPTKRLKAAALRREPPAQHRSGDQGGVGTGEQQTRGAVRVLIDGLLQMREAFCSTAADGGSGTRRGFITREKRPPNQSEGQIRKGGWCSRPLLMIELD